jgi:opacity protein-like surface antigen
VVALALPLLAASAAAQHDDERRWYLEMGLGAVVPQDVDALGGTLEFDPGYDLNLRLGRNLGHLSERLTWSVEMEATYKEEAADSDTFSSVGSAPARKVSSTALLGNLVFDWHLTPKAALEFGAGLGYAPQVDFKSRPSALTDFDLVESEGFVYQGLIGMRYQLGGSTSWHIGYKYFGIEQLTLEDAGIEVDYPDAYHVFEVGLRWGF